MNEMIQLQRTNSNDKNFGILTNCLDQDLQKIYGTTQQQYDQYNIITNLTTVVVAYECNNAIGCGCFKPIEEFKVELKRMYIAPGQRGKGVGSRVLKELETWAAELGFKIMVLETGTLQPEAIQLYSKQGFNIIPNYGQYIENSLSICMQKALVYNR
jgi:GNAT superfamily N-acetyltransferase